MMKKNVIRFLLLLFGVNAFSQVTVNTNLNNESVEMSQQLFGAFFEDINYGADGGLYAELVQNRSFEYHKVSGYTNEGPLAHWLLANSENLLASYSVINNDPLNANNTNYLKLNIFDMNSPNIDISYPLEGKVGVGSWATQTVFDSAKVVSGDRVWLIENFSDTSNWDVIDGVFSISNDTYIQSSSSSPALSIALTNIDTSVYTYTVKAMKTGGNEGFLFPFAYQDDNNYYWLNIGGWANTQHAIEKCTDGAKSTIANINGSINNNVWYYFKIEVTSTECRFYMNDELLFEIATPSPDGNSPVLVESGHAGVVNTGYFGMAVKENKKYKFSTYLKSDGGYTGFVKVCLHDNDGTIITTDTIESITANWEQYTVELTPNSTETGAYLSLLFNKPGVIYADMVSLFPEETFNNRENGLRKDLAQTIADLNPSFVRFPGGCVSHGRGLDNAYRWKETVGDVAQRNPNWNLWNYHQTYGLGFYEYFLYCEDIGSKPLPVLPIGISCQFREREIEPIEKMGPWIDDAVDLVEFANGDVDTEWGSVRAEMGHPEPFNLEYICLGNEEDDIPEFRERFIMFQDTLAKYCPEIKIIGTSGTDDQGSYYESLWQFSKQQNLFAVDEHYYNNPEWFLDNNHRYDQFDRNGPKVFIGEYASQGDELYNAICEAAYLTGVERNADIIELTCYAPLLNYQEDIPYHWHPDMILFDNTSVAKTANYYVQQMYGQNTGTDFFNSYISYDAAFDGIVTYSGKIGVGTWSTQALYDDIVVKSGNKTWLNEDFSSSSNNWNVIDGNFAITDGAYAQSGSDNPALSVASAQIDTTVYTITLKAKKTGGTEGFLIPFGFKDENNYYWLNIGGWSNSQHAIEMCKNGEKTQLLTKSGSIKNNQWYAIKIEITETLSKFYIDDELLFELTPPNGPVTSSVVFDDESNDYILKLVNSSNKQLNSTINFKNTQFSTVADLTVLKGAYSDRNTINSPNVVAPAESSISIANNFTYTLPAYSFSLMRFSADEVTLLGNTSVDKRNIERSQLRISPVPAKDFINVQFNDKNESHTVSILNMQGQVVKLIKNAKGEHLTIDRGNLPSGTYFIQAESKNQITTGKIVLTQ